MARIRNRDDFKQSILLRLGEPAVNLVVQKYGSVDCAVTSVTGTTGDPGNTNVTNVTGASGTNVPDITGCDTIVSSVMNQLDLVVDDALDYYKTASSGSSNEDDILLVKLQCGKSVYKLCDDVIAVDQPLRGHVTSIGYNFDSEESQAAVGLFSWQSNFGSRGIYGHIGSGQYDTLLTTEIALEYASLVESRYQKRFQTNFNDNSKDLVIFPTPTEQTDGKVVAMVATRETPDVYCFRDLWLQRYATALLSIQVGRNTSSFTGFQLPGGGEWNSSFYLENGKEEKQVLEEELQMGKYGNNNFSGGSFFTG